ncbi:hypothetical protein ACN9MZ_28130 [Pseudoduganella sp. S-14]|uniref:hypothetical protein n=1 Tax=Pseudoduganella sp. S-14 TaxID=3404065 RepID=UPI003CEA352B
MKELKMKQYEKVLGGLGMPEELIALATGRLQLPNGINEQPARCYGFPPALIPFWSAPDAMIYTGYWREPRFTGSLSGDTEKIAAYKAAAPRSPPFSWPFFCPNPPFGTVRTDLGRQNAEIFASFR